MSQLSLRSSDLYSIHKLKIITKINRNHNQSFSFQYLYISISIPNYKVFANQFNPAVVVQKCYHQSHNLVKSHSKKLKFILKVRASVNHSTTINFEINFILLNFFNQIKKNFLFESD